MGAFSERFNKNIFEFDMNTGIVKRAEIVARTRFAKVKGRMKELSQVGVVKRKDCVYFSSLNQKSAEKRMYVEIQKIKNK